MMCILYVLPRGVIDDNDNNKQCSVLGVRCGNDDGVIVEQEVVPASL